MKLITDFLSRIKKSGTDSNVKVVRILRSVPIEGVIYRADELVLINNDLLEVVPEEAFDAGEEGVEFRLSEGAEVIEHGVEKVAKPADDSGDSEGEIVD